MGLLNSLRWRKRNSISTWNEKRQVEGQTTKLWDHGAWSIVGRRKANEDTFILQEIEEEVMRGHPIVLAGIMDGHSGREASKFVQEHLPRVFAGKLCSSSNTSSTDNLMKGTWREICDAYQSSCEKGQQCDTPEATTVDNDPEEIAAGTTACLVAVDKRAGQLTFLNCGDSRAVVVDKRGKVRFCTVDHAPKSEQEKERLQRGVDQGLDFSIPMKARGTTKWIVPVGEYQFSVSRSLEGHFATSKGIINEPEMSVLPMEAGTIVILASDGLWEVMDAEHVGKVLAEMRHEGISANAASERICELAFEKGSNDNISAVVLYMNNFYRPVEKGPKVL